MPGHDFGWAVDRMREGRIVRRTIWKPGTWLKINLRANPPVFVITVRNGSQSVEYTPNIQDRHATDWAEG